MLSKTFVLLFVVVLFSTTATVSGEDVATKDDGILFPSSMSVSEVTKQVHDSFMRQQSGYPIQPSASSSPITGFVNFNVYCGGGGCSNFLITGTSTKLNTCYKNTKGTFTFTNATTNTVAGTITGLSWTFSDAACKVAVGKPVISTGSTTCTPLPTFASCFTISSNTPAIATNPGFQAIVTKEYTQAGCTDSTPVTANYLACGGCVNYNDYITKAPKSVIYDCTGTTITGAGYDRAGCVGTPGCVTLATQTCGAAPTLLQPQVDNAFESSVCQTGTNLGTPVPTCTTGPSPSSSSPAAGSTSSCFSGSETVQILTIHDEMNHGISSTVSTKMEDVRVGDRVLTARKHRTTLSTSFSGVASNPSAQEEFDYIYADVVYLPHGIDNQESVTYLQLTTESGRDIKMTKNHLLPVGNCDKQSTVPPLQAASDIVVGDCVLTISGPDKIVSIHNVEGKGVYTIITTEEYLVVNDIVVSPYGGVNHHLAHMYYNLHRLAYTICKAFATMVSQPRWPALPYISPHLAHFIHEMKSPPVIAQHNYLLSIISNYDVYHGYHAHAMSQIVKYD